MKLLSITSIISMDSTTKSMLRPLLISRQHEAHYLKLESREDSSLSSSLQTCHQGEAEIVFPLGELKAKERAKAEVADEAVKAEAADEAEAPLDVAKEKVLVDFQVHQHHIQYHDLLDDESLPYLNLLIQTLSVSSVV